MCFFHGTSLVGSSPRLWGTRVSLQHNIIHLRFIPTLVGNSTVKLCKLFGVSVHPHACGELKVYLPVIAGYVGSSPRLWGTLHPSNYPAGLSRFIPTLVGNSRQFGNSDAVLSVHPHACGELFLVRRFNHLLIGSSPRLWGTLINKDCSLNYIRFIPTLVGNSSNAL